MSNNKRQTQGSGKSGSRRGGGQDSRKSSVSAASTNGTNGATPVTPTASTGPKTNAWSKGAPHVAGGGSGQSSAQTSGATTPVSTANTNSTNVASTGGQNNNVAQGANASLEDSPRRHMHDRLGFLLTKAIGSWAVVTVTSGARYRGIFTGASADNELGVVLKSATKFESGPGEDDQEKEKKETIGTLVITSRDLADVVFEQVDLTPETVDNLSNSNAREAKAGFRTDTDISGNLQNYERELERWQPEEGEGLSLDDLDNSRHDARWDQFAVNQQKFGVQSTYNEHYYTTAINKNKSNFREIERNAEKIAQEITSEGYNGNIHIAEERGLEVDDSGLDEEDKYSGVDRRQHASPQNLPASAAARKPANNGGATANRYTPPQFRAPSGKKVQGVPYDPAIISSQLASPDGRLSARNTGSQKSSTNGSPVHQALKSDEKTKAAPAANASASTTAAAARPAIEKELAGNFRQFVNVEVERLTQKKQYLQKKEMSEQLEKLKKFSAEYKVNAPVPSDLMPILAKGREKQEEIKLRAAANAAAAKAAHVSPDEKKASPQKPAVLPTKEAKPTATLQQAAPSPAVTPATPSSTTTKTTTTTTTATPRKFNFNAPGFKPNPSAHSFTPQLKPNASVAAQSPRLSPVATQQQPRSPYHQQHTPTQHIQHTKGASPHAPPPPANPFFGNKKPHAKSMDGKFNPFLRAEREYNEIKARHEKDPEAPRPPPYIIERAYVQGPTWRAGPSDRTVDDWFVQWEATTRAQYAASSPRIAIGPGGGGFPGGIPVMQPAFEDSMRMMGSPPPMPGQMIPAGLVPAMGYAPQYGAPQFYGQARNGAPGQFVSPQMVAAQFPVQYGYGSPRGPQQAMMAPPMYYQGGPAFQPQYGSRPNSNNSQHGSSGTRHGGGAPDA